MGSGGYSSTMYDAGVARLHSTGKAFARAATATATGKYGDIAEILDPRKMKNGMRESCYAAGFDDLLSIVAALDCTGSMSQVPFEIQKELSKALETIIEQGITDHPNMMFMAFDDEHFVKNAAFQMSQFEIEPDKLVESCNEMIIPGQGGGNNGEGYHLVFYAAANHTKLETYEKHGQKGFLFLICDEQPYYNDQDPHAHGTTPEIAESVFGDRIEKEVTMLESLKKTCEKYHVFIIRPQHTSHGTDHKITTKWQKLLEAAGENPQRVLEVKETSAIISTMALSIGQVQGFDRDELIDVLKSKKAVGVDMAADATKAIVPANDRPLATTKSSKAIETTPDSTKKRGRPRKAAAV